MADSMTPGNRLYLYRLLSRELGLGKQVTIQRAEEILAADDIQPQDVGFPTVQAMLESKHFAGAAKVDIFKKGRILLTMVRNQEMEDMLDAAAKAEAEKEAEAEKAAAAKAKGGKATKAAKGGKGQWAGVKSTVKPGKPGGQRRKEEAKAAAKAAKEREEREAAERAEAERIAREQAEREAAERAEREAREAAKRAEREAREAEERARREAEEKAAAERAKAEAAQRAIDEQIARVTTPVSAREGSRLRITYTPADDLGTGTPVARQVKKGAEAAKQAASPTKPVSAKKQVAPAPATSHTSSPLKPGVPAGIPAKTEEKKPAVSASVSAPVAPTPAPAVEPAATQQAIAAAPTSQAAPAPAPEEVVPPQVALTAAPVVEPAAKPESPVVDEPEPVPAAEPAPQPPATPKAPARAAIPQTDRQTPSAAVMADYPRSISNDVFCPTPLLSTLSRILPIQVDLRALLDEDWLVARATGMVSGSRSRATFPLRYLREDGSAPIEVTLKRNAKPGSSTRWEMALVDGDDGKGDIHETASLEGLPLADEGAWGDLSVTSAWRPQILGPMREFASFAVIGTWDAILGDLARLAAPERWNYPGEAIIPSAAGDTRYGILREYLAVTFHRVREQNKLETSFTGTFAAFNTGLVTASFEEIHACFEATGSDIPWRFVGFAQAGSGELGRRITSELDRVPEPATYIDNLNDVVPTRDARIVLDLRALLDDCLGRMPRGFLREVLADMEGPLGMIETMGDASLSPAARGEAKKHLARFLADVPIARRRLSRTLEDAAEQALAACRRSYRYAVPVYDPASNGMKLLLPLRLVDDRVVDVALVVERQPSGTLQGSSLVTLPRAYACARTVSAEQPRWLSPEVALV